MGGSAAPFETPSPSLSAAHSVGLHCRPARRKSAPKALSGSEPPVQLAAVAVERDSSATARKRLAAAPSTNETIMRQHRAMANARASAAGGAPGYSGWAGHRVSIDDYILVSGQPISGLDNSRHEQCHACDDQQQPPHSRGYDKQTTSGAEPRPPWHRPRWWCRSPPPSFCCSRRPPRLSALLPTPEAASRQQQSTAAFGGRGTSTTTAQHEHIDSRRRTSAGILMTRPTDVCCQ